MKLPPGGALNMVHGQAQKPLKDGSLTDSSNLKDFSEGLARPYCSDQLPCMVWVYWPTSTESEKPGWAGAQW
ncbi:hypothetical protein D3C85_1286110 [compost metagenome]